MIKKKLRSKVLEQMKSQDLIQKLDYDKRLAEQFFSLPIYQKARTIGIYLAFDFEYDTSLILERALADGKRIVIPKTYPKGKMIFVAYEVRQLAKTSFGLLEPISDKEVVKSDIDLIVVPGVVFNQNNYRIGYGAGYFDRYLADFTGSTVSLIYPCQLGEFQAADHDIAVEEVLYDKYS